MAGVAVSLVLMLTACAPAVAGVAEAAPRRCAPADDDRPAQPPATPTGTPVLTVDDRVSFWISNWHTAPLGLAVYADGTVIRADGDGSQSDPLPAMVIGRVDDCDLQRAMDALTGLGHVDLGMPRVTDQGTTTVTVSRPGSVPVVLSAYALGIGDNDVDDDQERARATLTETISGLAEATAGEAPWVPDRFQLTRFRDAQPAMAVTWPLARPISTVLTGRTAGGLPCGVVEAADAHAVADALNGGPAASPWDDGSDVATLAVGVLVPGQRGSCIG